MRSSSKIGEHLMRVHALERDPKDLFEEGEAIQPPTTLEELEDLLRRDGPLELLSVEEFDFELVECLARLDKRLSDLAVAPSE